MGWGGSALAMIISLKNNQREKRELFKAYGKHNTVAKKRLRYKQASEEELQRIRHIIRRENRISIIKQIVIASVIVMLSVYGIIWLIDHFHFF